MFAHLIAQLQLMRRFIWIYLSATSRSLFFVLFCIADSVFLRFGFVVDKLIG